MAVQFTTRQQIVSYREKVLRAAQHTEFEVVIISTVLNFKWKAFINVCAVLEISGVPTITLLNLTLQLISNFCNMTLTPDYTIGSNGLPNIINRRRCSTAMKLCNISSYSNSKLLNKRGSADIYLPVISQATTTAATIFRLECNDRRSHRSDKAAKDAYNQRLKELQANSCNRTAR